LASVAMNFNRDEPIDKALQASFDWLGFVA
jgi:hypothetical protein